jgi:hypothetical protein
MRVTTTMTDQMTATYVGGVPTEKLVLDRTSRLAVRQRLQRDRLEEEGVSSLA